MPARRSLWDVLTRRDKHGDTASKLYGRLVTAARAPALYAGLGTPDTPEGRLEVLVLHVVLMLRRLTREGGATAELARALTETFITDMDDCLREMGVSDISVARKVKKAAAALFDRKRDYGAALEGADRPALARQLAAHVLVVPAPDPAADRFAGYAMEAEALLGRTPLAAIADGLIVFPDVTD